MGWFLSRSNGKRPRTPRNSPRNSARKRSPASGASAKWDPQRTLFALKVIAGIAFVVGSVYGWAWLERNLTDYATATRTKTPVVVLNRQPAWMSDVTAAKLKTTAEANLASDPMDRVSLKKTAAALAVNPWVDHVEQVSRATDGRVIVTATYRRPEAVIRTNHGFYVVDAAGVWLPSDNPEFLRTLPIITGIAAMPPGHEGEAWQGEDVTSAMALVGVLRDEPYLNRVASIDASNRDTMGRVKLVLYTERSWVVWGLAPGSEKMVEPEANIKLARLRRVVRDSGTLDADGRGVYLNGATIMTARAER